MWYWLLSLLGLAPDPQRDATGEVGGNGSIHWHWDPIDTRRAGEKFGHPGHLRVRMRYGSRAEAETALASFAIGEDGTDGATVVQGFVPVLPRAVITDDPPLEVRVDW